jgi:hypothetical protein
VARLDEYGPSGTGLSVMKSGDLQADLSSSKYLPKQGPEGASEVCHVVS